MKLKIIGSGGCISTPRPCCNCPICVEARSLQAGEMNISMIPVDETEQVTVFVIEEQDKKVIYAPCDVKPFPDAALFYKADVLIIGNTIVGEVLKDGFILKKDNILRDELFTVEEVIALRDKYRIKEVIITHLEEDWGKSYDDYKELEKLYESVRFAYDGLELCY